MKRLFAYGTLISPEIFKQVTGEQLTSQPAILHNHCALLVRGEHYPGLIDSFGSTVHGVFYDIPDSLWPRLDAYEGDQYQRQSVVVQNMQGEMIRAQAYLFRHSCRSLLTHTIWDYERFIASFKAELMRR